MSLASVARYLMGERPGMDAGIVPLSYLPTPLLHWSINIQEKVLLVDVSYYQGEIDFVQMKAAGVSGVIIRAGQRNWVDTRFKENWRKAKEAGLPRGSYWLYDSREDPKKQAALWWSLLDGDPGELVCVPDLEENYGGAYGKPEHMRAFILEFQRLSGLPDDRIVIYTGYFWWLQRAGNDSFFRRFGLWLAWYAEMEFVRVPPPWIETDLIFWQFTSSGPGALYGVSSKEIDLDWYCCEPRTYELRFGLNAQDPTNGGTMLYGKVNTGALNVRSGPDAGNAGLGYLIQGDHLIATGQVSGWWRLTDARRGGWTGSPVILEDGRSVAERAAASNDVWCKGSYILTVSPPPETDPPPPPPSTSTHVVEVYIDGVLEFRKELS